MTFDERRDESTPECRLCGKRVTGRCPAVVPAQCRHARVPVRLSRWGVLWADVESEVSE